MQKKILLIILLLFLVTGCSSVKYEIKIQKDLSVIESANMSATSEYFNNFYMNLPITIVKEFYEDEEWISPLKNNNYQYELRKDNTPYPSVFATKKYNSLNEYVESTVYKNQVFNKLDVKTKDNLVTLEATEYKKYLPDDGDGDVNGRYPVSKLIVNIKLPFVVKDTNADKIDKRNNIYTWTINEETEDKEIKITFDKTKIFVYNISWYISLAIIIIIVIVAIVLIIKAIRKNN